MPGKRLTLMLLALWPVLPAMAQDAPAVLRVGVVASPGMGQAVRGAGEIRRAFTQATGVQTRIFVARDTAALIEAQAGGRVHYAIHSAAGFAAAQALCSCVQPLVAPIGSDGDVGLRAVVYARASGPETLAAAAAARIVAGPADAPGPQLLAIDALEAEGAGDDIVLAGSQSEAEAAFAGGRADVLIGWEAAGPGNSQVPAAGTAARLSLLGLDGSGYRAIWTSDVVRYGPHAVRADLPGELKVSLKTFLVHLSRQQPGLYDLLESRHLGGYYAVTEDDYRPAERIVAIAAR